VDQRHAFAAISKTPHRKWRETRQHRIDVAVKGAEIDAQRVRHTAGQLPQHGDSHNVDIT
jgi:hypothetical protein